MHIQTLYKIKSRFVTREVGNELIIVPLSGNVAQMNELFTLNETGKFIWECLDEKNTFDDIVALLTEEFDIDENTARTDVELFLKKIENLLD
ncbi:MAG: PqqD family protein [Paludibacter sp.]|nr:PqqD family protein [Paludibacter sp.]